MTYDEYNKLSTEKNFPNFSLPNISMPYIKGIED